MDNLAVLKTKQRQLVQSAIRTRNSPTEMGSLYLFQLIALQFGFNFVLSDTDIVLRKVLRVWRRKVSGTKTERVARGFLYFRLCMRGGKDPSDVFYACTVEGMSLFKDFSARVRAKLDALHALKPVPSDADLMSTFRPAEKDRWRDCEAEAVRRRQTVDSGKLTEGDGGIGGAPWDGVIGNRNGAADFTMSMFAPISLIMRDEDQTRLEHAGSGQSLTKE